MTSADGTASHIEDQIRAAFRDVVALRPSDVVAAGPDEAERNAIRNAFANWTWKTIPREILLNDPGALHFMTPEGFRMFLPAYMLVSLESPGPAGVHLDSVVFILMPRSGREAVLRERLSAFDLNQLKAIKDYLVYMRDREALDFERGDYSAAIEAVEQRASTLQG